jgi:hypothetical protein
MGSPRPSLRNGGYSGSARKKRNDRSVLVGRVPADNC